MAAKWKFDVGDKLKDKLNVDSRLDIVRRLVDIDDGVEHYFVTDGIRLMLLTKFSVEAMYLKDK